MNSVQTLGLVWILYDFAEWISPNPIDKASKQVFGVKARKVNVATARKAIASAKKIQKTEEFNYGQKEIVELEEKIVTLVNNGRLGTHNEEAIKMAFETLIWIKDECRMHPDDVKIYLCEMLHQAQLIVNKGI